ncbi:MAG: glutamyl-tRNA reductase [Clostridium butyricum]|nr:glutamyl-tRNA reductase [Clostridium butyricum]
MIGLIGIKKNTPIEVREMLTIHSNKIEQYTGKLLKIMKEVVILSTCNRTEIYFNDFSGSEEILKEIFDIFNWNYEFKEYVFVTMGSGAPKHLFEVCCGFHSKIVGEDQILGQVRNAYEYALQYKSVSQELHRLFQEAITCGKKFKNKAKLFEIPVSSASIVANESISRGCTKFMVMGYGDVGTLVVKYILSHKAEKVYLVVRNMKIKEQIEDDRVKVISFTEKNEYIDDVDCIIGCTSAPHTVLNKDHINEKGKRLLIYDLAIPRDVEKQVTELSRVEVYNIDDISSINDENKRLRIEKMQENRYILDKYFNEFDEWVKLRSVSPKIQNIKSLGDDVCSKRMITFKNKCRDKQDINLANMLIKSTSDFYINRAIKVIKEETLKGREEECMKLIEKIFKMKF